ncbi:hypothetical protein [Microbacterium xylanilyticum]
MVTWYTADSPEAQARVRAAWADAPVQNAEVLGMLLTVAKDQVIAFAPEPAPVPDGEPVPDPPNRYVLAQLQQAKNLYTAGTVRSGGEFGEGEFSYQPRPLDKTIRTTIRPVDGKPHAL